MFAFSRATRNLRIFGVFGLFIGVTIGAILTGTSPASTTLFVLGAIVILIAAWASAYWISTREAAEVKSVSDMQEVFRGHLTKSAYGTLKNSPLIRGVMSQAAVRVWLAVSPEGWQLYCVGVPIFGAPTLLAKGSEPGDAFRRPRGIRWTVELHPDRAEPFVIVLWRWRLGEFSASTR